ncbi:MAG TPA: hypothetical protein VL966_08215 [Alphaproteobacteria bacterium]|nr:hypothetical protein [Alphaproteobacteria bacterium]
MLQQALAGISPVHVSLAIFLGGAVGFFAWACERPDGRPPAQRSFFMGMLGPLAPLLTQQKRDDDDLDDDDEEEDRQRLMRTIFPLVFLTAMVIAALTSHWPFGQ